MITYNTIWIVLLSVALGCALFNVFLNYMFEIGYELVFKVSIAQWAALLIAGLIFSIILADTV